MWLELSAGFETHERKRGREMGLQHFLGVFYFLCIYIFQDKTALLIKHRMALPQGYKVFKNLIMKWTTCREGHACLESRKELWNSGKTTQKLMHLLIRIDWFRSRLIEKSTYIQKGMQNSWKEKFLVWSLKQNILYLLW